MSLNIEKHPKVDKLLFRRQFVLSPIPRSDLSSWHQIEIGGHQFSLQAHPDLEVLQLSGNGIELTLLGYLIDPYNSDLDNRTILNNILKTVRKPKDIFEKTESYGGRWILIFHQHNETILFNDPAGLRQIFFTDADIPQTLCASQPSIIAEELDLAIDEEVLKQFIEPQTSRDKEYWFPGELSPYKGIRHLLPNHYLCLKTRSVHRFWPRVRLQALAANEAVEKSCALLRGQLGGISKRFDIAMTITAGMDSRTIFAASKEVSERIYYYTLLFPPLTEESPDIRIPSRLLSRLGLKHHIIECTSVMDVEFREIYMRNVTLAHDYWGNIIQGLYREYPQNRIAVEGSCSEIARCNYYKNGKYPQEINAEMLADLTNMAHTPLIIASFDSWLGEARIVENEYGIKILDLFHWEQRDGNWVAMAQQELDIAQESFSPFNCRELLTILLTVDMRLRQPPNFRLYRDIIYKLWPQALSEPINPVPISTTLRKMPLALLKKIGLYNFVRYVYHRTLQSFHLLF